jgi:hypothetical protein
VNFSGAGYTRVNILFDQVGLPRFRELFTFKPQRLFSV